MQKHRKGWQSQIRARAGEGVGTPGPSSHRIPLQRGHRSSSASSPSSPAMPHFICQHPYPIPKTSLLFLNLTLLSHDPCSSRVGFFWPSNYLQKPPAATNSPSSWLSVYHTDCKFYSWAGSLNQDTALGFPTDCQLTQAGLESLLSPIWSGMWTLGLKEQSLEPSLIAVFLVPIMKTFKQSATSVVVF